MEKQMKQRKNKIKRMKERLMDEIKKKTHLK